MVRARRMVSRAVVFLGLISLFAAVHARGAAADGVQALDKALASFQATTERLSVPDDVIVRDPTGGPVGLGRFDGQVLVVNFWATWCGPCVEELPALNRLARRMAGRPVRVVAVNEDRDSDKAESFLERQGLDALKPYTDPADKARKAFNITGLPTTWIVDSGGRAVGRVMGTAPWDDKAVARALLTLAESGN